MVGRGLSAAIARVNATTRPEHDVRLRAWVLGAVLLAVGSVGVVGAAPLLEVAVVAALLPAAFVWSWRSRRSSNGVAKILISLVALFSLVRFFNDLSGIATVDDARVPLTSLFLAVQVLHAFDLPQRRDLMFTLGSSLALLALAAASGPPPAFALLLLPYLGAAVLALRRRALSVDAEWAEGGDGSRSDEVIIDAPATRGVGVHLVTAVAISALLFAIVPLRAETSFGGLQFDLGSAGLQRTDSSRVGGELPNSGAGDRPFDPLEYFGFAERVDPRTVGQLSGEPILRVRTDRARPLRGVVFDVYRDGVWERSEEEPRPRPGLPVLLRSGVGPSSTPARVTATVELLRATPNLMFAPANPLEVWTAAQSITPWSDGTITATNEMSAGTIYSVVSEIDVTPVEVLQRAPGRYEDAAPAALARWTQLPDTVPQRVHDLARSLAASATHQTPYGIARAMLQHYSREISYSLGAAPTPDDADPADHLLFETRQGWCEPIATSMVVMLRSLGIPARFVTGFAPGERDLLSGQHVVRADDAHAWVELFVPDHGWIAVDPTGVTAPALDPEGQGPQVLLLPALRWLRDRLLRNPEAAGAVAAAAVLWWTAAVAWRRWRRRRRLRAAGPWAGLIARLEQEGIRPPPSATPRQVVRHARRLAPDLDAAALEVLRRYEEERRYRPPDGGDTAVAAKADAEQALARLSDRGVRTAAAAARR